MVRLFVLMIFLIGSTGLTSGQDEFTDDATPLDMIGVKPLELSDAEKLKIEQMKKLEAERADKLEEENERQEELRKQSEALINKLQEQRAKQEEAQRAAQEAAQKKAEDALHAKLDEAAKQAFDAKKEALKEQQERVNDLFKAQNSPGDQSIPGPGIVAEILVHEEFNKQQNRILIDKLMGQDTSGNSKMSEMAFRSYVAKYFGVDPDSGMMESIIGNGDIAERMAQLGIPGLEGALGKIPEDISSDTLKKLLLAVLNIPDKEAAEESAFDQKIRMALAKGIPVQSEEKKEEPSVEEILQTVSNLNARSESHRTSPVIPTTPPNLPPAVFIPSVMEVQEKRDASFEQLIKDIRAQSVEPNPAHLDRAEFYKVAPPAHVAPPVVVETPPPAPGPVVPPQAPEPEVPPPPVQSIFPAWMAAEPKFAAAYSESVSPTIPNYTVNYTGKAVGKDAADGEVEGDFTAKFTPGDYDSVNLTGKLLGLTVIGNIQDSNNNFLGDVMGGESVVTKGTPEWYHTGTLEGKFYGSAHDNVAGNFTLFGYSSGDVTGVFAGAKD